MNKSFIWKSLLLCGALLVMHLTPSQPACATPTTGGPACDPAFLTILEERGWREAEREIQMNESLIFKPDSVFALSCFGNALNALSPTFTNNASDVKNNTNTALNTYMSANFNHGYLGAGSGSQSTTTCGQMRTNWISAKCSDLTATTFSSFSFTNVSTGDKRVNNPQTCTTNPTSTWTSTNTHLTSVPLNGTTFDSANLFLKITDPLAALLPADKCSPGIPTGIDVGTTNSTYGEKVCPNPGCVPVITSGSPPDVKCCDQTNTSNRCDH